MPYVILVNNDGTLYGSQKERIIQREKLFNKLWFLVPQYYNGYDMSKATLTMRYLLPISKEFKTEILSLSDEKYKECLKYVLPIDTNLTKEHGGITLNLTFTLLDVDDEGNVIQRVRKTEDYTLNITPIPNWDSIIPDSSLAEIDQRILKQDAQIMALTNLANILCSNTVDNLVYDDTHSTLQLSANGVAVGDKVSVKDILDDGIPVVDLDSDFKDDSDAEDNNNDCDCVSEDNVVEF